MDSKTAVVQLSKLKRTLDKLSVASIDQEKQFNSYAKGHKSWIFDFLSENER